MLRGRFSLALVCQPARSITSAQWAPEATVRLISSKVQLHRLGVGVRQHQGSAGGALGADGGEDIGPFIARVARAAWPRTDPRPNPGQRALLADPRFVLEPDFQRLGADPGR